MACNPFAQHSDANTAATNVAPPDTVNTKEATTSTHMKHFPVIRHALCISNRHKSCAPNRGFTLLELLVVLVIIGLLAGIVGPRLFSNVDKSKVTTARAQINILSKSVDQLRLDIGRYPTSQEGLNLLVSPPADGTTGWNGPYLSKALPMDPWGTPYHYVSPGTYNPDYDIVSYGPSRIPGGVGTNAEIHN